MSLGSPTIASSRQSMPKPWGINVVGYVRAVSGLGEAARSTIDAVQKLGLRLSVIDLTSSIPIAALDLPVPEFGAPYDTTIYQINPGALLSELDHSLHLRGGTDRQVGCFFWESEEVPREWLPAFDLVDEVWAASEFLAKAFQRVTDKPIRRLHPPFSVPSDIEANRGRFGWSPDEFVVVFVADALSGLDRKNPVGLVDAFEAAFAPSYEGVRLVLKINHANRFPVIAERIRALGRAPVELWTQPVTRPELLQLMASASLYVSLHRSEGLGLTLLEAMSLGVPVMATAYGGNLDFMDDTCGLLVDWSPALAGYVEGSPYNGHRWAEPNLHTAAEMLRTARREPDLLSRLSTAGRQRVSTRFPVDGHARSVGALLGVEIERAVKMPGEVV
ncbi:MAG: glycosyltransferase family 4 protein [Acidimicrobiia bacterium]